MLWAFLYIGTIIILGMAIGIWWYRKNVMDKFADERLLAGEGEKVDKVV